MSGGQSLCSCFFSFFFVVVLSCFLFTRFFNMLFTSDAYFVAGSRIPHIPFFCRTLVWIIFFTTFLISSIDYQVLFQSYNLETAISYRGYVFVRVLQVSIVPYVHVSVFVCVRAFL